MASVRKLELDARVVGSSSTRRHMTYHSELEGGRGPFCARVNSSVGQQREALTWYVHFLLHSISYHIA